MFFSPHTASFLGWSFPPSLLSVLVAANTTQPTFPIASDPAHVLFPILSRLSSREAAGSSLKCRSLHTYKIFPAKHVPFLSKKAKSFSLHQGTPINPVCCSPKDANRQSSSCYPTAVFLGIITKIDRFCLFFLSSEDILRYEDALWWPSIVYVVC